MTGINLIFYYTMRYILTVKVPHFWLKCMIKNNKYPNL